VEPASLDDELALAHPPPAAPAESTLPPQPAEPATENPSPVEAAGARRNRNTRVAPRA